MKIIGELSHESRSELMRRYTRHPLWHTHIGLVVTANKTYQIEIYPDDYKRIYLCAGLPDKKDPYISLSDALKYVKAHRDFLKDSAEYHADKGAYSGRLSGVRVSEYLRSGIGVFDCFLLDAPSRNRCEVVDGMHRLVARGLSGNKSPIVVLLGSNRQLKDMRYIK